MTSTQTITNTVGSALRRLPRWLRSGRPGESPAARSELAAVCPDGFAVNVASLRHAARRLGVLPPEAIGWFGALVRERLRRSLVERTTRDWERVYPGTTVDERAQRHIAVAARRSAVCGGLSAAGAHVGEAVTILTEGLAAPMCVPAIVASIAGEVVASAKVQIDLVFDLASFYGVAFDVSDTAELAGIFDLALHSGKPSTAGPDGELRRSNGDEMLSRLGRGLLEEGMLGLVPFVGIPYSVLHSHRATARVGAVARSRLRCRVALSEALRSATFRAAPGLLLEGAWLLATVDGTATHDELLIVASIARAVAPDGPSALARLDASEERSWLARAASLQAGERAALLDALVITAGLRGPTRLPERRFLARVSDALGLTVDFARIEVIHRRLCDETVPTFN